VEIRLQRAQSPFSLNRPTKDCQITPQKRWSEKEREREPAREKEPNETV